MKHRPLTRKAIALSLAGGVIHALLALWMSEFVRGRSFWGMNTPETLSGIVFGSATVVGLVLLGGIPIVLLYRNGLVTPLLTLSALFVWVFYTSWHHFEEVRTTDVTSISLYYDSLFGLLWFIPLATVLFVGGIEYLVRRRSNDSSFTSVFG